ncbi:MAG: ChrR family anti-sigma-E factor [Pseudomonadota bacterium]
MTISHHATDETLMRYAAGRLSAGPALVLAIHLEGCPTCRARVSEFEALGGVLLEQTAPAVMPPGAFAAALRVIEAEDAGAHRPAVERAEGQPRRAPMFPGSVPMPLPLQRCEIGPWRWVGLGVRASAVKLPHDPEARVTLLRVGPGRKLPEHGHFGTELTQVLVGSFSDRYGRYMPGDLSEMDHEIEHQPIVDSEEECICIAAPEGGMRLTGFFGRMIQPFIKL